MHIHININVDYIYYLVWILTAIPRCVFGFEGKFPTVQEVNINPNQLGVLQFNNSDLELASSFSLKA